ncbi:MAG: hypothetical protein VW877_03255 [Pseudomonadaceae bacterium]
MSDDDSLESQLRAMLRDDVASDASRSDDQRLDRVLHRAHIHGAVFDLLGLVARWGWVLSEGGSRGMRNLKPSRRSNTTSTPSDL